MPTGLDVLNVKHDLATVLWSEVEGAYQYVVEYNMVGRISGAIKVSGNENSVELTGLSPLTEYEIKVRISGAEGGISQPTASMFFTTAPAYCEVSGGGGMIILSKMYNLEVLIMSQEVQLDILILLMYPLCSILVLKQSSLSLAEGFHFLMQIYIWSG
jgi:hypothetical protein